MKILVLMFLERETSEVEEELGRGGWERTGNPEPLDEAERVTLSKIWTSKGPLRHFLLLQGDTCGLKDLLTGRREEEERVP